MKHVICSVNSLLATVNHTNKTLRSLSKCLTYPRDAKYSAEFAAHSKEAARKLKLISAFDDGISDNEDLKVEASQIDDESVSDDDSVVSAAPVETPAVVLEDYPEAQDTKFMKRVLLVLHEFRSTHGDEYSISRKTWEKSHYRGLLAYVVCRILSNEKDKYNPTNTNMDNTIAHVTAGDNVLFEKVKQYCQRMFGLNPSEFNHVKDYDTYHFKRRFRQADWFYEEVYAYLGITGWKLTPNLKKDKREYPSNFTWYTKQPPKNEVKTEKGKTEIKTEKKK